MPMHQSGRLYRPYPHSVYALQEKSFDEAGGRSKKPLLKWIKTRGKEYASFYWQDGYGAFSVNPSEVDAVIAYIVGQHEHHKKRTFQDEYRAFLKKYAVDYDERYVWD